MDLKPLTGFVQSMYRAGRAGPFELHHCFAYNLVVHAVGSKPAPNTPIENPDSRILVPPNPFP